jgi:hypothetical protein
MKEMDPVSKEEVETKYFVVCTNALSQLPCREGLEHYGGDAYFDFNTWCARAPSLYPPSTLPPPSLWCLPVAPAPFNTEPATLA